MKTKCFYTGATIIEILGGKRNNERHFGQSETSSVNRQQNQIKSGM